LSKFYEEQGRDFPWRRAGATIYEQVVSEVLLQQTRAETVAAFFPRFLEQFPGWQELADSTEGKIGECIRPLGIWRRRARTLWELANEVVRLGGEFPGKREKIEALPGVGQYVANAVELFCHGRPRPLLDSGMARVLERYFGPRTLSDIRYDPYLQELAQRLVETGDARAINWGILDVAAIACRGRIMQCDFCPLRRGCKAAIGAAGKEGP
jgi:A/G-specific adenine glycosylase